MAIEVVDRKTMSFEVLPKKEEEKKGIGWGLPLVAGAVALALVGFRKKGKKK